MLHFCSCCICDVAIVVVETRLRHEGPSLSRGRRASHAGQRPSPATRNRVLARRRHGQAAAPPPCRSRATVSRREEATTAMSSQQPWPRQGGSATVLDGRNNMFKCLLQCYVLGVPEVSKECCKCFTWLLQKQISMLQCCKIRSRCCRCYFLMLQMLF
jgi:hypothetical protein